MARVLVIGDSHVGGLASRLQQLVPGIALSGQNGTHTAQWVNFNPGDADTIVVVLGTNDISKGRPASETAAAARQIVQRAAGRRVIWALPPLYNPGAATLNALRSSGAEIVESLSLPLHDGWHPTAAGYQIWADAIAAKINASSGWSITNLAAAGSTDESKLLSMLPILLIGILVIKFLRG